MRKPEEGLQALQEDLMKFTRLAYPEADARTTDTLGQVPSLSGPPIAAVDVSKTTTGPDGGGGRSILEHR